jgi:hypothetical protein
MKQFEENQNFAKTVVEIFSSFLQKCGSGSSEELLYLLFYVRRAEVDKYARIVG